MKLKKQTKIRIRKTVEFIRTALFYLALMNGAMAIGFANEKGIKFMFIFGILAMVCFGISYGLDYLLFETAYADKKN